MAGYGDNTNRWNLKAICVAFVFVISVWFLFMGMLASGEIKGCAGSTCTPTGNHKHATLMGRERRLLHVKFDPIYVSKRRVPSGPDPFHNRYCFFFSISCHESTL